MDDCKRKRKRPENRGHVKWRWGFAVAWLAVALFAGCSGSSSGVEPPPGDNRQPGSEALGHTGNDDIASGDVGGSSSSSGSGVGETSAAEDGSPSPTPDRDPDEAKEEPNSGDDPTAGQNEAAEPEPLQQRELLVEREDTADGFRLKLRDGSDAGSGQRMEPFVAQTVVAPDRTYAVHLVRRMEGGSDGLWYRIDAVVVRPDELQPALYTLVSSRVEDDAYAVDSIARAFGFTADGRLGYVEPTWNEGEQRGQFHVSVLDARTGQVERIFEYAFDDPSPDFFARTWFDSRSDGLYVNRFEAGTVHYFDLKQRVSGVNDRVIRNSWPQSRTFPSSNGQLVWAFADESGKLSLLQADLSPLNELVAGEGRFNYPPVIWSPFDSASAVGYTVDDGNAAVIEWDVMLRLAPQKLALFAADGRLVREIAAAPGRFVDWVGWIEDGEYGVLRTYALDRKSDSEAVKTDISYELLAIRSGQRQPLREAAAPEQVERAKLLYPSSEDELAAIVDPQAALWWKPESQAGTVGHAVLSEPGAARGVWVSYSYETGQATLFGFDRASGSLVRLDVPGTARFERSLVADRWAVNDDARYVRLP